MSEQEKIVEAAVETEQDAEAVETVSEEEARAAEVQGLPAGGSVSEAEAEPVPASGTAQPGKAAQARKRVHARRKPAQAKKSAESMPVVPAGVSLDAPELYTNREISWIEFDRKVLETAMDRKVPLLSRLSFLSIFFNNLDEFYMVRVMNLQRQARSGVPPTGADRMTPARQLAEIRKRVLEMTDIAEDVWFRDIKPALEARDVTFGSYEQLPQKQKDRLNRYFDLEVFPVLTPQAVDAGRPFPMISNISLNFVVALESISEADSGKIHFARLKCPSNIPRFLFIPKNGEEPEGPLDQYRRDSLIIMIEDLVERRMESLFPGFRVKNYGIFRVTRNTDGNIEEDEADDLLSAVRDYVEQRRFGNVVRLELERGMPQILQDFLVKHLDMQPMQIYKSKLPLGFSEFMRIAFIDRPSLQYPPRQPNLPRAFDPEGDIFAAIAEHDQLVYHPYDSFGSVLNFLKQAAMDPKVVAVKQTLYRCGSHSPVVQALLDARRMGKQVTAVVELKARFDEERNINWASELEKVGVNVVYGFAGLKIHAKLCMVVRRESSGLRRYVHIGTGNYNAGTAKIYTDLGLFTADKEICNDVQELFNVMTGFGVINEYRRLFVSPNGIRRNISRLVREEAEIHRRNGTGHIIIKCNQLVDPGIIKELYAASQAGVRIECIVRGICALRPGIPGVSETISVHSIVGELLEHARIYYFNHDGDPQMYIGSADMMQRNLNGRIEVLTPVLDPVLRENCLSQVAIPQLKDNLHAWNLQPDGSYRKISPKRGEAGYDSQAEIGRILKLNKRG